MYPERAAVDEVSKLFSSHGWKVKLEPKSDSIRPDLVVSKGPDAYAVDIKELSESRPDRVNAFLSQAILQARAYANQPGSKLQPLAIILVPRANRSLLKKFMAFLANYVPDAAAGLVSDDGARYFKGAGLDSLNADPRPQDKWSPPALLKASDLFSDLNQWMLKVLLAPEIPESLLAGPRSGCRNASELSAKAKVSAMSASRFVRRLLEEGFLEQSSSDLRLVRRRELFRQWQAVAHRSSPEMRMCFLNPASQQVQLHKFVERHDACLGLYAAADALNLGHVSGAIPYVYVRRLPKSDRDAWKGLVPAKVGEAPHLILKQALAPESVFRGAVRIDGACVCDVLQVWLDVFAHPSRGAEQSAFLAQKVLGSVLGGSDE